jgi:hypothetical protein
MKINPMPLADQSVLRKTGFDESNRASTGELVNASFIESNKATGVSVHSTGGIALREYRQTMRRSSFDVYLKPWYISLIETAKTDEGQQTLRCFWQRPVLDGIIFALGRAVSIGSDVMPYVLESVDEELTLVQPERYSVFEEYNTDALKEVD